MKYFFIILIGVIFLQFTGCKKDKELSNEEKIEHVWVQIEPDSSYTSAYDTMIFSNGIVTSKLFFFKELSYIFPSENKITLGSSTYSFYFREDNTKLHILNFVPESPFYHPPGKPKLALVLTKIN